MHLIKKNKYKVISIALLLVVSLMLIINHFSNKETTIELEPNVKDIELEPYVKDVVEDHYDVIVVGGDPEGVAAAVSAARNGLNVLLLEERDALGGLFTFGELNYLDIPINKDGAVTSKGIFKEWWNLVDNVATFDIDKAKKAFLYLVQQEDNITLSFTTKVTEVTVVDDEIQSIITEDENGTRTFTAQRYIDATGDGDLAAMAGVPFTIGQEDIGNETSLMAVTMMIHLENVDWKDVKVAAKNDIFGSSDATEEAAWGFGDIDQRYQEEQDNVNLRGLNIGRSPNGDVYINALQLFDVDGLDDASKQAALEKGELETISIVAFLNEEFPGFEEATIASFPKELYIRETRHMNTLYRLKASDLWENNIPEDTIAMGGYPVDIQSVSDELKGYIVFNPNQYGIPLRSLIPENITNLLVTSKASGYDSIPAGSTRVVPTGMAVAEAGGVAASLSINEEVDFHQLSESGQLVEDVQAQLVDQGAYLLKEDNLAYPYEGDPDYQALREVYSLGFISAGYSNEIPLENEATVGILHGFLKLVAKQTYSDDEERKNEMLEKVGNWVAMYDPEAALTSVHVKELLTQFPEINQTDKAWISDFDGNYTHREVYKTLALFIPSEEE